MSLSSAAIRLNHEFIIHTFYLPISGKAHARNYYLVLLSQAWIMEMASHVKSIDRNHLLEAGLEGFYGQSTPQRKTINPPLDIGTDFIANNRIPGIDFATAHSYPDQW